MWDALPVGPRSETSQRPEEVTHTHTHTHTFNRKSNSFFSMAFTNDQN